MITMMAEQLASLPASLSEPSKHFVSVESRIMEKPSECRLVRLLNFQARFCSIVNIDELCFIMDSINTGTMCGSFVVRWLVPSALVDDIMKSSKSVDQSFYEEFKIASLTLDGMWLYMNEAELEVMWLNLSNSKLVDQFHIMHKQIVLELKIQNAPRDDLSQCLMNQYPNLRKDASIFLSEAIVKLHFPPSGFFVDFEMLRFIVTKFGSECLKDVMMSYCKYMPGFIKQLTAQQLLDLLPIPVI